MRSNPRQAKTEESFGFRQERRRNRPTNRLPMTGSYAARVRREARRYGGHARMIPKSTSDARGVDSRPEHAVDHPHLAGDPARTSGRLKVVAVAVESTWTTIGTWHVDARLAAIRCPLARDVRIDSALRFIAASAEHAARSGSATKRHLRKGALVTADMTTRAVATARH
jgi:hypothetical protein